MYSNYLIGGINVIKNKHVLSTCLFYFLFLFSLITRNLNNKKLFCYILAKISENGKLNYKNYKNKNSIILNLSPCSFPLPIIDF